MNRDFSKEDQNMVKRNMKICSSLLIWEIRIKKTTRDYLSHTSENGTDKNFLNCVNAVQ